jgi:hypothetical protein
MSDDEKRTNVMQQNPTTQMPAVPGEIAMPQEIQGQIGKQLRQIYGKMLAEPLPDKFSKLLADLAKAEPKS